MGNTILFFNPFILSYTFLVFVRLEYPISYINFNMSTKRPADDEKVTAKKAKLDENAAKLVEEYDEEDVEEEEVLDEEDEDAYGDEEEDLDDEEEDGEERDEEEDGEHEEEEEEDGEDGEEEDEDQ